MYCKLNQPRRRGKPEHLIQSNHIPRPCELFPPLVANGFAIPTHQRVLARSPGWPGQRGDGGHTILNTLVGVELGQGKRGREAPENAWISTSGQATMWTEYFGGVLTNDTEDRVGGWILLVETVEMRIGHRGRALGAELGRRA